ncbi:hypothetical protein M405DRAFT_802957 [Rhizopogon salebrosus TDB-379]|nr:hypothetical protein M405DRAFT_802957 [Rhizopogon salebrosus TDB-379]
MLPFPQCYYVKCTDHAWRRPVYGQRQAPNRRGLVREEQKDHKDEYARALEQNRCALAKASFALYVNLLDGQKFSSRTAYDS